VKIVKYSLSVIVRKSETVVVLDISFAVLPDMFDTREPEAQTTSLFVPRVTGRFPKVFNRDLLANLDEVEWNLYQTIASIIISHCLAYDLTGILCIREPLRSRETATYFDGNAWKRRAMTFQLLQMHRDRSDQPLCSIQTFASAWRSAYSPLTGSRIVLSSTSVTVYSASSHSLYFRMFDLFDNRSN
jgi:hypothetical protein